MQNAVVHLIRLAQAAPSSPCPSPKLFQSACWHGSAVLANPVLTSSETSNQAARLAESLNPVVELSPLALCAKTQSNCSPSAIHAGVAEYRQSSWAYLGVCT